MMDESRFSCPVESVNPRSPVLLVVLDNQFCQLINIVPSTTDYATTSGGEEALNIFPTNVTRDILLWPSYNRNVPMYPNEEFDYSRH